MLPLFALLLALVGQIHSMVDFVPVIVDSGPSILTFLTGDKMVLSCVVKGYPTPAAKIIKLTDDSNDTGDEDQWKLLDMELDFVSNVVGDSVIEVTLTQIVTPTDSGWYRCKTENMHGHTHSDIFVEVFDSFTSEQGFQDVTVKTEWSEEWVTASSEEVSTVEWATEEPSNEDGTEEWGTGSSEDWVYTEWITEWLTGGSADEWNTESSVEWVSEDLVSEEWVSGTEEWITESAEEWTNGVWKETEEWGTVEWETDPQWFDGWFTEWFQKEEWFTDEWVTDEWVTDEWVTDELVTDEWVTDEMVTDEWVTDEWVTDEWVTDERATEELAAVLTTEELKTVATADWVTDDWKKEESETDELLEDDSVYWATEDWESEVTDKWGNDKKVTTSWDSPTETPYYMKFLWAFRSK